MLEKINISQYPFIQEKDPLNKEMNFNIRLNKKAGKRLKTNFINPQNQKFIMV